ncbi:unnamed protein product [Schistosoma margrebowiei]|uniref:Uncharacterized protein n=1 Tax=Schistosoma margrebowiei TaxID=48269 RepID=A0A183L8L1_9TREM|nr:unnamed protein product [Schistosoma margrebowiei]
MNSNRKQLESIDPDRVGWRMLLSGIYSSFEIEDPRTLNYSRIKKLIQPHECMEPNEYLIEDKPIINKKIPISLSDTFNSLKSSSSSSYLKKVQSTHSIPNCSKMNTNV